MRRARTLAVTLLVTALAALAVAACGSSSSSSSSSASSASSGGGGSSSTTSSTSTAASTSSKSPIVIGAAIDLSNTMKFFDGPAEAAAQLEVKKINAAGGVDGHPLQFLVENDQLNPARTRAVALDLTANKKANVLWVTCDVDWATPST